MIHPVGYVVNRYPQMPSRTICNYTKEGRAVQKIKTGAPEAILAWLARHSPPSMPIEEADNRISKYSAQKGKCAIFGTPLEMGGVVVLHIDPYKGKDIVRFHNLMLVSITASGVINEPDPSAAKSMLAGIKVDKVAIKTINKLRSKRKFKPI